MTTRRILIAGGGIGGLSLALNLHKRGISCHVYEVAPEIKELGVGITLLPHAMRELTTLGVQDAIIAAGIENRESCFFNRFGQLLYQEPRGKFAGYAYPEIGIHRGKLHKILYDEAVRVLGRDRIVTNRQCLRVDQDEKGVWLQMRETTSGSNVPPVRADVAIACDGIHSAVRKQLYPDEGGVAYQGINMWRGVTRWKPFLDGNTFVRIGWHKPAKVLIYPIRDRIDAEGRQLINWVCDIEQETPIEQRDWNRRGRIEDFIGAIEDWTFPWLDVPAMLRHADGGDDQRQRRADDIEADAIEHRADAAADEKRKGVERHIR